MYPINKVSINNKDLIQASTVKVNKKIKKIFYKRSHQDLKLKARKNKYHFNHNPKLKIVHKNKINLSLTQSQRDISMLD